MAIFNGVNWLLGKKRTCPLSNLGVLFVYLLVNAKILFKFWNHAKTNEKGRGVLWRLCENTFVQGTFGSFYWLDFFFICQLMLWTIWALNFFLTKTSSWPLNVCLGLLNRLRSSDLSLVSPNDLNWLILTWKHYLFNWGVCVNQIIVMNDKWPFSDLKTLIFKQISAFHLNCWTKKKVSPYLLKRQTHPEVKVHFFRA